MALERQTHTGPFRQCFLFKAETSRRAAVVSAEAWDVSLSGAATGADLEGSSKNIFKRVPFSLIFLLWLFFQRFYIFTAGRLPDTDDFQLARRRYKKLAREANERMQQLSRIKKRERKSGEFPCFLCSDPV